MARRHYGARHMAWVRSFQHKRRKHNYPMAGTVLAANRPRYHYRKHKKRNPSRTRRASLAVRGFFGLPPLMPVVYGASGFIGTAGIQGVVTGFLPAEWVLDPTTHKENMLTKYGVIAAALVGTTWIAKAVFGAGPATLAGIGGGIYALQNLVHDFMPGVVPGMREYAPIGAYAQIRAYRQIRQYAPVGAPAFGAENTAASAPNGGNNIVSARFRRLQGVGR